MQSCKQDFCLKTRPRTTSLETKTKTYTKDKTTGLETKTKTKIAIFSVETKTMVSQPHGWFIVKHRGWLREG